MCGLFSAAGSTTSFPLSPPLKLCDVQPGVLGGARSEFVFCGRLDNLAMSFVSLQVCV